ncbi:hypothetical protein Noda2021_06310 [Candidatus Dependentiae bacterium Noda2021]|nr:hypothetical protein Noda2021_06310 [Candidatus Dependentiae bacterium Noda2021]
MKLHTLYYALSVGLLMVNLSSSCMDEASKPLPDEISAVTHQSAPSHTSEVVTQTPHDTPAKEEDYDYDDDEYDNDEQEEVLFTTPDNVPLAQQPVTHVEYKPQPAVNYESILNTQVTHLKEIQSELKEIKNALNELIEFKRPVLP